MWCCFSQQGDHPLDDLNQKKKSGRELSQNEIYTLIAISRLILEPIIEKIYKIYLYSLYQLRSNSRSMTICIMFIQRLFAFNGCLYIDDLLFPNLKKKKLY